VKKGSGVFAVVITMLSCGCKPTPKTIAGEPSLQETQTWMHSFAADRGSGATFEGSGCSATITWLENGGPYYTFSFSFQDLDPNSAKTVQTIVSPPALRNMWRATAVTTNNLKRVAVYNYESKQRVQDSVIEGIPFGSGEDADRFAKALRHATVLCGGKPSTF
jgi:hypothetical protein